MVENLYWIIFYDVAPLIRYFNIIFSLEISLKNFNYLKLSLTILLSALQSVLFSMHGKPVQILQ